MLRLTCADIFSRFYLIVPRARSSPLTRRNLAVCSTPLKFSFDYSGLLSLSDILGKFIVRFGSKT
jgi:hypothetical protein